MKTLLFPSLIAVLFSANTLSGAGTSDSPEKALMHPVDPAKTPEGLSDSDWTSPSCLRAGSSRYRREPRRLSGGGGAEDLFRGRRPPTSQGI